MRKIFMFLLLMLITFGLLACSNKNTTDEGGITGDNRTNTMYEDRIYDERNNRREGININKINHKNPDLLNDDHLTDGYIGRGVAKLEEIPTIQEHIYLDKLVAEVESDIPNRRTILFKNNDTNEVVYKSIYVKDDGHLKIVELAEDQIIFNGNIR